MSGQNQAFLDVWIDGVLWADADGNDEAPSRVKRLEIDERTDGPTSLRLVLDLASTTEGDWDLLADGKFALFHRIAVQLGIGPEAGPDDRAIVFDGFVTAVSPVFAEHRVPDTSLEIDALDASCLLFIEERTVEWIDQSDADIVRAIYGRYGFDLDVADTTPVRELARSSLVQRCTDGDFVRMLARRNGFEAYVERSTAAVGSDVRAGREFVGHFHLPKLDAETQPALELMPESTASLKTLRLRWDGLRPTKILSGHIDERSRRIRTSTLEEPRIRRLGETSRAAILAARLPGVLGRDDAVAVGLQYAETPHEEVDLGNLAWAALLEADWLAEAQGVVFAERYPKILRARRPVELAGAGEIANGDWYVRGAKHIWQWHPERKFEVEVDLLRNGLSRIA